MDDNVFARLVSLRDEDGSDGSAFPLMRGSLYHIGRDVKCEVKIADVSVLSFACCIDYVELQGARITPASGTNVVVNEKEFGHALMLQNGDIIRFGNKKMRIDIRRILPTRTDESVSDQEQQVQLPLPKPLLVDTITPPRDNKRSVRPKTQCKSLLSSTKPPVVSVSKKAEDSPVKRQLFSDDDDENKKPAPTGRRIGRKTKAVATVTGPKDKQIEGPTEAEQPNSGSGKGAAKRVRKVQTETAAKKKTVTSESSVNDEVGAVRRTTRSTSVARSGNQALAETVTRKTVRFTSKTKK